MRSGGMQIFPTTLDATEMHYDSYLHASALYSARCWRFIIFNLESLPL